MRKAILVVALIGASFAGGAVVNGPCLGWAQNYLTHQLGGDAPAPDNVDLAAPSIDEIPTVDDTAPGGALPAAPLPPLSSAPAPEPAPVAAKAEVAMPAASTAAEPAAINLDAADPPLTGPSASLADDVPAPPAPKKEPTDIVLKDDEPEEIGWKDAPDSHAPAKPVLPSQSTSTNAADPAVAAAGLSQSGIASWSDMRKRLHEAGVARYWIEGEPGGTVRLRCLIPVVGQRAVGQQFEGDGATESQAAASVLRRIALWKATETP